MIQAVVVGIEYFLPSNSISNEDIEADFPEWSAARTAAKTGIERRQIASKDECASDLAVAAANKLFDSGICCPNDVDFILLCTQSPDYSLPTTACLLQRRLNIPMRAGALDFNLGCSGFVYGLGLAAGLIATGQAQCILLLTAETYSKYIDADDKASRMIFGDGAAATLIGFQRPGHSIIGPFLYGTDGRGAPNLIVPGSGARKSDVELTNQRRGGDGNVNRHSLYMDGNSVFQFAVSVVPDSVKALLCKAEMTLDDIDLFVFHQANAYLVEEIAKILGIARNKIQITLRNCANTVSSTIPIALKHAESDGCIRNGDIVMLVGFGVGYSWAATILRWGKISNCP